MWHDLGAVNLSHLWVNTAQVLTRPWLFLCTSVYLVLHVSCLISSYTFSITHTHTYIYVYAHTHTHTRVKPFSVIVSPRFCGFTCISQRPSTCPAATLPQGHDRSDMPIAASVVDFPSCLATRKGKLEKR